MRCRSALRTQLLLGLLPRQSHYSMSANGMYRFYNYDLSRSIQHTSLHPHSGPQNPAPAIPPAACHVHRGVTTTQSGTGTPVRRGSSLAASSNPLKSFPATKTANPRGLVGWGCSDIMPLCQYKSPKGLPEPFSQTTRPSTDKVLCVGNRTVVSSFCASLTWSTSLQGQPLREFVLLRSAQDDDTAET